MKSSLTLRIDLGSQDRPNLVPRPPPSLCFITTGLLHIPQEVPCPTVPSMICQSEKPSFSFFPRLKQLSCSATASSFRQHSIKNRWGKKGSPTGTRRDWAQHLTLWKPKGSDHDTGAPHYAAGATKGKSTRREMAT